MEKDAAAYDVLYAATESRKVLQLADRINQPALCARASSLRDGIGCNVDLSPRALADMIGGGGGGGRQNCHAVVTFGDGVEWIARFRIDAVNSPPPTVRDYIICSEVATMKFLAPRTKIPVPRVYDWWCERGSVRPNEVGVGYILMEKIKGKSLDWTSATAAQKEKVMGQLADIFIELESHPFDKMGSLMITSTGKDPDIQGLATPALYRSDPGGALGPFFSSRDEAEATVNLCLDMVVSGEMGFHDPTDEYLMRLYRLEVLDGLTPRQVTDEKFYIKHPYDKGDHLLVNAEFDIVGVIDWEWARTVTHRHAFSSPCLMWPVREFYEGDNGLSKEEEYLAGLFEEKGRPELAKCVLNGRRVQRFWFDLLSEAFGSNWKDTVSLFQGLRQAFGDERTWDDWKQDALTKHGADERLGMLMARKRTDHSS